MTRMGARPLLAAASLALFADIGPAWSQESCVGGFDALYRLSDAPLRAFLQGIWQSEDSGTAGTVRRTTYVFVADGTFTRDETVCTGPGACQPSVLHGYFAAVNVQPGVIALALSESGTSCTVSRFAIRDNDTIDGTPARLRRLQ